MKGFSQLDVEISFSTSLLAGVFILHLSAVIAVMMTALAVCYSLLFLLMIFINYHLLLKALLGGSRSIIFLSCNADLREWYVGDAQQRWYKIKTIHYFSHYGYLVIINMLDEEGKRHWVVIPRDSISYQAFRRLSVVLKYQLPLLRQANKN